MINKATLRKIYKNLRSQLDPSTKLSLEAQVVQQLRSAVNLESKSVHVYLPIKRHGEIDTFPLLQDNSVHWVLSKSNFNDNSLSCIQYDRNIQIAQNDMGIPEPISGNYIDETEIDIVIAPLLCFDLQGYRVGYGKGFYDRFLAKCRADIEIVGLSLFDPVEHIENLDEFDIPLSIGITPNNIYYF